MTANSPDCPARVDRAPGRRRRTRLRRFGGTCRPPTPTPWARMAVIRFPPFVICTGVAVMGSSTGDRNPSAST